jgi:hypothetical protein
MDNEIIYREYEKKDIEGILKLWEQFSGWGNISENQFQDWYINTPLGESQIIIALENNCKIVGQIIFLPSEFRCYNKTVMAYRVFAPIIDPIIRTNNFQDYNHPVFKMYRYGLQIARNKNISIIYMFPSVGWLKVIKTFPLYNLPLADYTIFECANIQLEKIFQFNNEKNSEKLKVKLISSFNREYDKLWLEAAECFPINCGVVRNKERLNFKLSPHLVAEVRSYENKLIGYVAIRKVNGLIVDALAKSESDLEIVLKNVIWFLGNMYSEEEPPPWKQLTIKAILTPHLKNIFSNIPHEKIKYDFAFAFGLLNESIESEKIKSSNWYMMPDD